jgi:hypothetical protein
LKSQLTAKIVEKSLEDCKMIAVLHLLEASEDLADFGFSHDSVVLRELNELLG